MALPLYLELLDFTLSWGPAYLTFTGARRLLLLSAAAGFDLKGLRSMSTETRLLAPSGTFSMDGGLEGGASSSYTEPCFFLFLDIQICW